MAQDARLGADSGLRSAVVLAGFLALSFAVAVVGSIATIANVEGWYATAGKAAWNPPNSLFAPAWTVLYALMSVAGWLVWRERPAESQLAGSAFRLYFVQLALNAAWTPIFFALYPTIGTAALWIALAVIVLLDLVVPATIIAFWKVSRWAAILLVPYWLWLLFATSLNLAVAALN